MNTKVNTTTDITANKRLDKEADTMDYIFFFGI